MKQIKKKKKIIATLLTLFMLFSMIPALTVTTQAAGGVESRLNALRTKFPNGYFWNHQVTNNSNNGDNLMAQRNEAYSDYVTSSPCATHNGTARVGQYDCNYFDGGIQCFGFAGKIFYEVFGQRKSALTKNYSNKSYVQVGDYVRLNNDGHSAVVLSKSGNNITVVECNLSGDGQTQYNCKIRWDATYSISSITYYIHATNYDEINGSSAPSSYFTALWADNIGTDDARINATINLTYIQSCGFYLGTSQSNMSKVSENTYANVINIWFDLKDYRGALSSDTTYYYKVFIVVNGTEYCSGTQSFTTAHTHSYSSKTTKAATCTQKGVKTFTCSCGNSYTQDIPMISHTIVVDNAVAATCTQTGLTEGKRCSACQTIFTAQETIAKLSHADKNADGKCDLCDLELNADTNNTEDCSCMCHESGLMKIIYAIVNFFWKIFGINKDCACGAVHY